MIIKLNKSEEYPEFEDFRKADAELLLQKLIKKDKKYKHYIYDKKIKDIRLMKYNDYVNNILKEGFKNVRI